MKMLKKFWGCCMILVGVLLFHCPDLYAEQKNGDEVIQEVKSYVEQKYMDILSDAQVVQGVEDISIACEV